MLKRVANISLAKFDFFVKKEQIVLLLEMSFIDTRVTIHWYILLIFRTGAWDVVSHLIFSKHSIYLIIY